VTPRAARFLLLLALLFAIGVVYAPTLKGTFIWDDRALVTASRGARVRELFARPFWAPEPVSEARPPYYRPLVAVSYRMDLALADMDPRQLHGTNLTFHLVAVALLVQLARRLGASAVGSLLAGATWGLAPRLSESVAWISGRTDVLATALALGAMLLWPWYGLAEEATRRPRRAWLRAVFASVALLGALLAKEVALAAALAMGVAAIAGAPDRRRAPRRLVPLVVALTAYFMLREAALGSASVARPTPLGATTRAVTVLETVGRYLLMSLDPWRPSSSIGMVGEPDPPRIVLGAGAVALALVLGILRVRRIRAAGPSPTRPTQPRSGALPAMILTAFAIAPVVHVLPLGLAGAVAADRLLYLPLAGVALAVAVESERRAARARALHRHAFAALALALALSFAAVVRSRTGIYRDELAFRLGAAEDAHPANTAPRSVLAVLLRQYRELELACRAHASARAVLERTGRSGTPRHTRALENLAACRLAVDDEAGAAAIYEPLALAHPEAARIHYEVGLLELHRMDLERAGARFRRALQLDPALDAARRALVDLARSRRDVHDLATPEAREAEPVRWAALMSRTGRRADAVVAWRAVTRDPRTRFGDAWDATEFLLD